MFILIEHDKQLDAKNGDTIWQDTIVKEMYQVPVYFKILEDGQSLQTVWTNSTGHHIFDVKMEFTRKSIWFKDGHSTPDPETPSCAGFVSLESIQISLRSATLRLVDLLTADIINAYLQAPSLEKHFTIRGLGFDL